MRRAGLLLFSLCEADTAIRAAERNRHGDPVRYATELRRAGRHADADHALYGERLHAPISDYMRAHLAHISASHEPFSQDEHASHREVLHRLGRVMHLANEAVRPHHEGCAPYHVYTKIVGHLMRPHGMSQENHVRALHHMHTGGEYRNHDLKNMRAFHTDAHQLKDSIEHHHPNAKVVLKPDPQGSAHKLVSVQFQKSETTEFPLRTPLLIETAVPADWPSKVGYPPPGLIRKTAYPAGDGKGPKIPDHDDEYPCTAEGRKFAQSHASQFPSKRIKVCGKIIKY